MPDDAATARPDGGRRLGTLPGPPGLGSPLSYISRLKALDLWVETLGRLKAGASGRSIATWLIQERGFPANEKGLRNALNTFRGSLPPGELVPPTQQPAWLRRASQELLTGEGLLQDLEWAIGLVRERIKQGRRTEKAFPMVSAQVGADLALLGKLAETKARLALELGVITQAPPQVPGASFDLGMYSDLATKLSPAGRGRVLDMAAYVLRKAVVAGEDPQQLVGTYADLMAVPPDVRHRAVEIIRQGVRQARQATPAPPGGGDGAAPAAPDGATDQ